MAGQLLATLVSWAGAIAYSGGSVLFVTPNYDGYLVEELNDLAVDVSAQPPPTKTNYTDYGIQRTNTTTAFGYSGERTDPTNNGLINYYARSY